MNFLTNINENIYINYNIFVDKYILSFNSYYFIIFGEYEMNIFNYINRYEILSFFLIRLSQNDF